MTFAFLKWYTPFIMKWICLYLSYIKQYIEIFYFQFQIGFSLFLWEHRAFKISEDIFTFFDTNQRGYYFFISIYQYIILLLSTFIYKHSLKGKRTTYFKLKMCIKVMFFFFKMFIDDCLFGLYVHCTMYIETGLFDHPYK